MRAVDRVPHIIRAGKSSAAPQKWVVVDCETLPIRLEEHRWQHTYRLSVAAFWTRARANRPEKIEFRRFHDPAEQVAAIMEFVKAKERIGIAAHNLDYDSQVLDTHSRFRGGGFQLTKAILEKGKWVQRWQSGTRTNGKGSKSLLMIDLCNFFPMPLRALAVWLGMRKGRLPSFEASDEAWFRYCEKDVHIELAALQHWLKFCEDNELGYFAPTIAGQAFNAYKHRFMKHNIYVHIHDDVVELEKAAHYGGRCEPFWRGRAPLVPYLHVDSNSMYGSVMAENDFPVQQIGHYSSMSVSKLSSLTEKYSTIARVTINTDVPAFPARIDGRLCFPVGTFDTVLATPELRLAIEYGYLESVREAVTYLRAPIFKEYARYFWNLRQQARKHGDEFTAKVAKRFLAALHGKFGQRIFTSELILTGADREDEIWSEYDIEDGAWYEYRALAGRVERRVREIPGRDTLIAISAEVASYARIKLWNWIVNAGIDNVFYVDTDSLIIKREALSRIEISMNPTALGSLRIINDSRSLYIRGKKWYRFGSEKKRAGISGNARDIGRDQFEYDAFRSLRWALRHDNPHSAIVEEVKISAPYRNLLQEHGIGHRIAWRTALEYAEISETQSASSET